MENHNKIESGSWIRRTKRWLPKERRMGVMNKIGEEKTSGFKINKSRE